MVKEGDRIELVYTDDQYTSLDQKSTNGKGAKGTVTGIELDPPAVTPSSQPERKVWVDWDDGRHLALIMSQDDFKVL